jgi:hypothetical protein
MPYRYSRHSTISAILSILLFVYVCFYLFDTHTFLIPVSYSQYNKSVMQLIMVRPGIEEILFKPMRLLEGSLYSEFGIQIRKPINPPNQAMQRTPFGRR